MPATHVALLRGINVSGKHTLPMKDLASLFEEAGASHVRTYIQSGNVVFRAARAESVAEKVTTRIEERFGFQAPIALRTSDALRAIPPACPFDTTSPKALYIVFLTGTPSEARAASLDPERSPPDRFAVQGSEIYLHLPNGVARGKLTNAYFDSKLATTSTVRNWRTVLELVRLCSA